MINNTKIDFTPILHTLMAILVQTILGFYTGLWGFSGLIGCVWFIAREHTQAEYRWISKFGKGKRENMPWYGGFDLKAWDLPSLLDCIIPVIGCLIVYFIAS